MKRLLALSILLLAPCAARAAERVAIHFNVPDTLAGYNGAQPVTFGVPFEQGELSTADPVAVVDEDGNVVSAQFEVSSTWTEDGAHVRWLLVDTNAEIIAGRAAQRYLTWGEGVHGSLVEGPAVDLVGERVSVDVGPRRIAINPQGGSVGKFTLTTGDGRTFAPVGDYRVELERHGPVRTVIKTEADYVDTEGASIAQAVTRYRLYPGRPFMRVYHTMIWQTDDETTIAGLSFDAVGAGGAVAGVDGRAVEAEQLSLTQTAHDQVIGSAEGKRLDGYVAAGDIFAAVRWPWQQFPLSVAGGDGGVSLGLIGPVEPMSLKPADIAVDNVMPPREYNEWDIQDIVVGAKKVEDISPRGVAKTWEILLWFDAPGSDGVTPQQKNATLQTPVYAFADPAFATRASLPNVMSPRDDERFPVIEAALSRVFDWYTTPLPREGDLGLWNFGDVQWSWTINGWPIYRYWMNQGKGWSVVPWVLYLRSGERKYLDFAEANARHVMDIDTCHVPEWTYQPDGKRRGAAYSYSAMHWSSGPFLAEFQAESEYLPNCYYMTGYERARDVMFEVAEALAKFEYDERWLKDFRESRDNAHRHLYAMVKELGVLYEATWDPRLKERLDEYFDLTMKAQGDDGNFPNVKTNHYLSQPLNLAVRLFGPERAVPVIKKWQAFQGDVDRVGSTGAINGPMSLWTLATLYQYTDEPRYLDLAGRIARTQAMVIVESDTEYNGMPPIWGPETGPHLRDWVITMAALTRRGAPPSDTMVAMQALHGRLPVSETDEKAGWTWRHAMLLLDGEENELTLDVFGLAKGKCRLRVIDPAGDVINTVDHDFTNFAGAAGTASVTWPTGGAAGVYAVELLTQGRFPDVIRAKASNGKLLHLLSPQQVSLTSEHVAGQLWAKPRGGEPVIIGKAQNRWINGRAVIRDEDGKTLATTQVTRTREQNQSPTSRIASRWVPDGEPCELPAAQADDEPILQLIVPVASYAHMWWSITGIEPYVATTREQWFDPAEHQHPDMSQLTGMERADH